MRVPDSDTRYLFPSILTQTRLEVHQLASPSKLDSRLVPAPLDSFSRLSRIAESDAEQGAEFWKAKMMVCASFD